MADFDKVNIVVEQVLSKYERIDVLINNAASRLFKRFCEFDSSEIESYVDVNFGTPIMLVRKVYPYMKERGYGRIINISSFSAFSGYSRGSLYCSTKCALKVFSESVGKETNSVENVTLNVICPDSFSTVEGHVLSNYEHMVRRVNKAIDNILKSKRNGQVIVIAKKGRVALNCLREFKNHIRWLVRE
jgi:short-subunit dehydrogenase